MVKFGVGQAIKRREDDRLLTGRGRFVDDIRVPGALHAAFVRSPHAHARVTAIDADAARDAVGVVAILTGADLKADGVGSYPPNPMLKSGGRTTVGAMSPLASEVVRFVGQPVAVVVAESREQADSAANLVMVDYEPLPAVATVAAGLAGSRPPERDTRTKTSRTSTSSPYTIAATTGSLEAVSRFWLGFQITAPCV